MSVVCVSTLLAAVSPAGRSSGCQELPWDWHSATSSQMPELCVWTEASNAGLGSLMTTVTVDGVRSMQQSGLACRTSNDTSTGGFALRPVPRFMGASRGRTIRGLKMDNREAKQWGGPSFIDLSSQGFSVGVCLALSYNTDRISMMPVTCLGSSLCVCSTAVGETF